MEEFESYRQTVKAWQAFERRMLSGETTFEPHYIDGMLRELRSQWAFLREDRKLVAEQEVDVALFRPGLYAHFRHGIYTATKLVTHHDCRRPMVIYVSHTYGGENVRPLRPWPTDPDGWNDVVDVQGVAKQRFAWLGTLPSRETIDERLARLGR